MLIFTSAASVNSLLATNKDYYSIECINHPHLQITDSRTSNSAFLWISYNDAKRMIKYEELIRLAKKVWS